MPSNWYVSTNSDKISVKENNKINKKQKIELIKKKLSDTLKLPLCL